MHELSLCNEMIHTLEDLMEKESLSKIEEVTVEIGEVTGVLPRYMQECWIPASAGTKLEGCALKIHFVEAEALCSSCGKEYALKNHPSCPYCGSEKREIQKGFEFEITEIKGS